jgi:hypothetical protein
VPTFYTPLPDLPNQWSSPFHLSAPSGLQFSHNRATKTELGFKGTYGCHNSPPLKEISPRDYNECIKASGVGWLPRWKELGVVGSHEVFMFPHGFIFGVIIPLYLVELSSLVACDSVLLVENLDGTGLVGQVGFQWNGVLHNHISRRFQTYFELRDVEHIMYSQQL